MKRRNVIWWSASITVAGACVLVASAGDVHEWVGSGSDNNWTTALNWLDPQGGGAGAVPSDQDSAVIDDTSPRSTIRYNVTNQDYTMEGILLGDGMTLDLVSPNRLNIGDRMTIEGDVIIKGNGTLDGISTEDVQKLFIDGGIGGSSLTKEDDGDVAIGRIAPSTWP